MPVCLEARSEDRMAKMRLFGEPGWGSAIVETQLVWYGLEHDFERVGDLFKSEERPAAARSPQSTRADPHVGAGGRDGADRKRRDHAVSRGRHGPRFARAAPRSPRLAPRSCAGWSSSSRTSIRRIPTRTIRRGSSTARTRNDRSRPASRPIAKSSIECSRARPARRGFSASAFPRSTSMSA